MFKLIIIGGTGGMGQLITNTFKDELDIYIYSRDPSKARKFASELGVNPAVKQDIYNADIIIVSVPISQTLKTCSEIAPLMKPNSLLIDISSVKTGIVDKLTVPDKIEYISMHPLFGPLGSFNDQNVILIPVKTDKWIDYVINLLEKHGSTVSTLSFQEHDRIMSNVQVIHHFSYLCLGVFLSLNPVQPQFFTRSYKKTIDSFKNYQNNLSIMLDIQKLNPYSKSIRQKFSDLVSELAQLPPNKLESRVYDAFSKFFKSIS
ncbi:MAG: prephenate dehydrogenase/arogenate dehydrogenase family protein [Candidatus Helarchaeota archaeon]